MTAALEARLDQVLAELAAVKKELAALESALCQCQPQREHDDYQRPAQYLHAADCPIAASHH